MNRIFLFLFLIGQFTIYKSQSTTRSIESNVNYQKFTKRDGLPSSKTRTVFEDSQGYIWVGTYGGVSRFDGRSFYNFSNQENRSQNEIEQIIEIEGNKIITLDYGGTIDIIDKNRVIKKIKNDTSKNYAVEINNFTKNYFVVTNHPANTSNTILDFYDSKTLKKVRSQFFPFIVFIEKTKGNAILFSVFNKERKAHLELYNVDSDLKFHFLQKQEFPRLSVAKYLHYFISDDRKTQYDYEINKSEIIRNERKVTYSKSDLEDFSLEKTYKKDGYFTKTENNHLQFINNEDKIYDFGDLIKLHRDIFIDSRQRFWVCAESALYLFPSIDIQTVKLNLTKNGNDEIWSMTRRNNDYYFSSYVFGLYKADVDFKTKSKVNTSNLIKINSNVAGFGATKTARNGLFVPFISGLLYIDEANKKHSIDLDAYTDVVSTAINPKTKELYFSNYLNVFRLDEKTLKAEKILNLPYQGMNSVLDLDFDNNNNLMVINGRGMLVQENKKWKAISSEKTRGYSLCLDSFGSNWIGSNAGLCEMKSDKIIKNIDFGFPITIISDLYVYKKKWLLIGTSNELILFNLERYHEDNKIEFFRYDFVHYFAIYEGGQNNFFEDKDGEMWWPMNGKLVKFNPEKLIQKQPMSCPIVFGILLKDNDKFDQVALPKNNRSIKIDKKYREVLFQFSTPFNVNSDIVKYRTRLIGLKNDWEIIENARDIVYRNLSPGKYQFEIQASIDGKSWTKSAFSNPIDIGAYFYETIWFKLLLGIIVLLIFFYFIKNYFQEKQKKLETQNSLLTLQFDLNKMELQSLNKQLDPHEIKNLLASISPEIQEKAPESYRKMLKLLNITKASLNNSSMTESVKNQVQQIEDFLSLEKYSLSVPFEYSIENNIESKGAQIPRLMLKNLIENAIKHGIKRNENGGNINVVLMEENQFFKILVDDTGKGRKLDTISDSGIGTSTYRNLFATLNRKNTEAATFEIIDKEHGTKVEVKIPINYKYE